VIKSAVTISLVAEAQGGPFVFWDDFAASCARARELGFDAVELFAPAPEAVPSADVKTQLQRHGLALAAVGTGAGMVKHGLSLVDPDAAVRAKASDFIRSMIDYGGPFGAPAIIGSMQGRWGKVIDKPAALKLLGEALVELGDHARQYGIPLIYEPLNRYETNLICTMADGAELLDGLGDVNAKLLADLFHMNIEEADIAEGIRDGGPHIGHVHFVDSHRQPAGTGHIDFAPIAEALREIGYDGYTSAEAFPLPNPDEAARLTIEAFREHFRE
jgi:sugar phosphate isomerase/epimerase